jgi:hypothetical protein
MVVHAATFFHVCTVYRRGGGKRREALEIVREHYAPIHLLLTDG